LVTLVALAVALSAYAWNDGAEQASTVLRDAAGQIVGSVKLTEDATGVVHVNGHVQGLSSGLHGIHIHAVGACDGSTNPPFTSAGGHFNPLSRQHGLENPNGAHAGDLPNLTVNAAGFGHLNAKTDRATLSGGIVGLFDANGSAFVIHANADDQVTDPTGNSGSRIACGVITAD
jgi:Cu-Zn family superoxide dismutase